MRLLTLIFLLALFHNASALDSLQVEKLYNKAYQLVHINNDGALKLAYSTLKEAKDTKNTAWIGKSKTLIGHIFALKKEFPKAISYLKNAEMIVEEKRDLAKIYTSLTYIFFVVENPELVIEYANKAKSYTPAGDLQYQYFTNYYLAEGYTQLGLRDSAIQYQKVNIKITSNDTYYYAQSLNNLGLTHIRFKEASQAIPYLEKALQADTANAYNQAMAYNNLSYAYYMKGEYAKSVKYGNSSLALNISAVEGLALRTLAVSYIELGELDKAKSYIDKSKFTYADNLKEVSANYYTLGQRYDKIGRTNEAKLAFMKSVEVLNKWNASIAINIKSKQAVEKQHSYMEKKQLLEEEYKKTVIIKNWLMITILSLILGALLGGILIKAYSRRGNDLDFIYKTLEERMKG